MRGDLGPLAWLAGKLQAPAGLRDPLFHADDAEMMVVCRAACRIKAYTIVCDL